MFWHLDGCNQDEDFAFDLYCATREEWEAEQQRSEDYNRRFDEEWAERERLGVTSSGSGWSQSFSVDDHEIPIGIRVFGLGCQLAELITQVRGEVSRDLTSAETQQHIDQLNRNFGNLRDILQNADASLTATLLEPALNRFDEALDLLTTYRPDLAESCQALSNALSQLLDPPSADPGWEDDHSEFPF